MLDVIACAVLSGIVLWNLRMGYLLEKRLGKVETKMEELLVHNGCSTKGVK